MRWDSTADAQLFMAVLKVHSPKLNHEAIAKLMGNGCTAKAVSHRISKLRSLGGDVGSNSTSSVPNTPTKATPTKRKRSEREDILTIKKEHIERSLESDAGSETYNIDAVATGSPKKRRRQQKVSITPAVTVSFASTNPDVDHQSPHTTASFYDSSEQQSPFTESNVEFLHSFDPISLGEHFGTDTIPFEFC
ncbi:hypothetical protein TWF225_004841 [Orbilia oligospora]|nr:hypothetical protein TWF225_004841 [Orbilia oligospora]KAF3260708.1 hypothetical protein TWF128_003340 [Orbilia oligospora]KAF3272656.1 hypothetical protein TWF217_000134 [Orbilia oligospora]KAF3293052.1 hypothetical protein TWF132_005049 [Orbilia oligospora]